MKKIFKFIFLLFATITVSNAEINRITSGQDNAKIKMDTQN